MGRYWGSGPSAPQGAVLYGCHRESVNGEVGSVNGEVGSGEVYLERRCQAVAMSEQGMGVA